LLTEMAAAPRLRLGRRAYQTMSAAKIHTAPMYWPNAVKMTTVKMKVTTIFPRVCLLRCGLIDLARSH
jgi:hypothetical protein